MKKIVLLVGIFLVLFTTSCKKDDPPRDPSIATLIFPEENSECNEGTILSDTQSSVVFRWEAADHAQNYVVSLRDLTSNATSTHNSTNTEAEITINRATPYSWFVTANGAENTTPSQSAAWKFYNAGLAVSSHAPFPADVIAPTMGSTQTSGSITLQWAGSDVDNDIDRYDILFDTVNPPVASAGTSFTSSVIVTAAAATTYYWQVITKDAVGNSSNSVVFQFRTN